MSTPRASVLLPVRDGAYLPEALASLSAQTFGDFEVCLQLDGADDDARRAAAAAAAADDRVRVSGMPARGIVAALNAAASRARSDLFVRMDADDVSTHDRLARLVAWADARDDLDFLASRVRYVSGAPLSEGMKRYEDWLNRLLVHEDIVKSRFVECVMPHPAWAVRRRLFESLGGYRDGDFPEDYDFFLRAVEAGARFGKVDAVLLDWRDRPDRLSRRDPRYARRAFFELKFEHLVPVLRADGRDVLVVDRGSKAGRRWSNRLDAAGLRVRFAERIPDAGECVLLVAVGGETRDHLLGCFARLGFVEGEDLFGVQ